MADPGEVPHVQSGPASTTPARALDPHRGRRSVGCGSMADTTMAVAPVDRDVAVEEARGDEIMRAAR